MIAYDLQCANGHTFEGWFEDGETFRGQREKGLIACPVCNDTAVTRIPSTFAIKTSGSAPKLPPAPLMEMEKLTRKVMVFVEKNFDDVGANFSREALKMHYGVIPHRNIRGVSTDQEEEVLRQEGIEFHKIPLPPETKTES